MSYLAIARAALANCEISEKSEKSPELDTADAERLKARIIEAATVDPAHFDRAEYERLTALWDTHEMAGGAP